MGNTNITPTPLTGLPMKLEEDAILSKARFLKTYRCRNEEFTLLVKVFFKPPGFQAEPYMKRLKGLKSELACPHTSPLLHIGSNEKMIYIIRPYFHSSLLKRISARPFLSPIEKKWLIYQMLYYLKEAESRGLKHGDLKCENIMVTSWNWIYVTDHSYPYKPDFLSEENSGEFSYFFDTSTKRVCYISPERFYSGSSTWQLDSLSKWPSMSTIPTANISSSINIPSLNINKSSSNLITNSTSPSSFNMEKNSDRHNWHHLPRYTHSIGDGVKLSTPKSSSISSLSTTTSISTLPIVRLTSKMDVFSIGCVIAELWLEDIQLFEYSSLLAYRAEKSNPNSIIERINDIQIRELVSHMIQRDPEQRLTGSGYFEQCQLNQIFPPYFDVLHQFFSVIMKYSPDRRVRCIAQSLNQLHSHFIQERKSVKSGHFGFKVEKTKSHPSDPILSTNLLDNLPDNISNQPLNPMELRRGDLNEMLYMDMETLWIRMANEFNEESRTDLANQLSPSDQDRIRIIDHNHEDPLFVIKFLKERDYLTTQGLSRLHQICDRIPSLGKNKSLQHLFLRYQLIESKFVPLNAQPIPSPSDESLDQLGRISKMAQSDELSDDLWQSWSDDCSKIDPALSHLSSLEDTPLFEPYWHELQSIEHLISKKRDLADFRETLKLHTQYLAIADTHHNYQAWKKGKIEQGITFWKMELLNYAVQCFVEALETPTLKDESITNLRLCFLLTHLCAKDNQLQRSTEYHHAYLTLKNNIQKKNTDHVDLILPTVIPTFDEKIQNISTSHALDLKDSITQPTTEDDIMPRGTKKPCLLGYLMVLNVLCAMLKHIDHASTKLIALDCFQRINPHINDEIRLQTMIPFIVSFLDIQPREPSPIVRAQSIKTLANVVSMVHTFVDADDTLLFPEYLLPLLNFFLKGETEELVLQAHAASLSKFAQTAKRFLEYAQCLKKSSSNLSRSIPDPYCGTYMQELQSLRETFRELVVSALGPDSSTLVKKTLLNHFAPICELFGPEISSNTAIPLIFSCLNGDWELKCAVFDNMIGISRVVGGCAIQNMIFTVIPTAIHCDSEFVVYSVLNCLSNLCQEDIFSKQQLFDISDKIVPLLLHPNSWIRGSTCAVLISIESKISKVDTQCFLIPRVHPFLKYSIVTLGGDILRHALLDPVPRYAFEKAIQNPRPYHAHLMPTISPLETSSQSISIPTNSSTSIGSTGSSGGMNESNTNDFIGKHAPNTEALTTHSECFKDMNIIPELQPIGKTIESAISSSQSSFNIHLQPLPSQNQQPVTSPHGIDPSLVSKEYILKKKKSNIDIPFSLALTDLNLDIESEQKLFLMRDYIKEAAKCSSKHSKTNHSDSWSWQHLNLSKEIPLYPNAKFGYTAQRSSSKNILKLNVNKLPTISIRPSSKHQRTISQNHLTNLNTSTQESIPTSYPSSSLDYSSQPILRTPIDPIISNPIRSSSPQPPNAIHHPFDPLSSFSSNHNFLSHLINDQITFPEDMSLDLGVLQLSKTNSNPLKDWRPQGILMNHFQEHHECISQIQVSNDSIFFASSSYDGTVKVWNTKTMEMAMTSPSAATYYQEDGPISSLVICGDSHSLASSSINGTIHVYRVDYLSQKSMPLMTCSTVRHLDRAWDGAILKMIHFECANSSLILYATDKSQIHSWDLRMQYIAWTLQNPPQYGLISSMIVSPGSYWLVVGTDCGYLTFWDLRFRVLLQTQRISDQDQSNTIITMSHHYPSSNTSLWTSYKIGALGLWDLEKMQCQRLLQSFHHSYPKLQPSELDKAHSSQLEKPHLSTSQLGKPYLFTPTSSILTTLDQEPSKISTNPPLSHNIQCSLTMPNTSFILTGGTDKKIRYWDLNNPSKSFIVSGLAPNKEMPIYNTYRTPCNIEVTQELKPMDKYPEIPESTLPPRSGHYDMITDLKIIEQPKYTLILSSSRDGVIKAWK